MAPAPPPVGSWESRVRRCSLARPRRRADSRLHDKLRALAVSHNAVLVDVYAGMKDDLSLIGVDDLHSTARGYKAMASIYRDAIAKAFDATTSAYGAPADSALTPSRTIRSKGTNR
jgi:hypothetical protein